LDHDVACDRCDVAISRCRCCGGAGLERAAVADALGWDASPADVLAVSLSTRDAGWDVLEAGACGECRDRRAA